MYGDVTLDESLTINQGETLTIPQGSTLNTNGNLTNNGTIVNKGTMNGDPTGGSGTVVSTPAITTESLPDGTAGQSYTATLEATGNDITWSANGLPAGLTLDAGTGAITGTPTTDGQFPVTVTATNSAGSVDHAYTLSIKPAFVPVTGLKLSSESLTLQEKGSHTLTATVEPADATNKSVTWESSDTDIATVDDDGTVTAVSAGKATIIATAADGSGVSASCEVTVTHSDMVQTPKKDATCTAYGTEGYWTCGICGKHYKDEGGTVPTTPEESVIPATGHDYGEPAWSWSEDGAKATATFTCKNDGSHQATEDAAVTSAVKTPATCTEAGVTTYTATVEFNGKTYTSTKEVTDIPAAGHKLTKTEAEAPTCTEPGSAEYWTCGVCDKVFSDAAGEHEITPEDAVIPATGHEFEGGLCSVCGARDTSFSPALVSGDGAKWTKGSSKGLTFVSSAAFVDLVEVRLDGRVLSASEYAVREGSTIVTLPAKLLEGLKAGDHELLIVSGSGTVRASLTVAEAAKVEEAAKTEKASADELPASGDSTAPALAVAAAAAAGAGLVLLSRRRAAR
ncbi:MAG TPA: Ig-like domain-containing protein [Candidatus Olsenella pullicola]|nr:Ig-like domain-containing protein [Candidatus Olsenella pullicola]